LANTGGNQSNAVSGAVVQSGNALAINNDHTIANIDSIGQNLFSVQVNALGQWNGNIINWHSPGEIVSGISGNLSLASLLQAYGNQGAMILNNNEAIINNQVSVTANSGNNILTGDQTYLYTGQATAIANIYNLANLNIWGSNWFGGTINIIGNWGGDVIFAYPDLAISLATENSTAKMGDSVVLNLRFGNMGYDEAKGEDVSLVLPEGAVYEGDSSGVKPLISGNTLIWAFGDLPANKWNQFDIKIRLTNKTAYNWFNLVKPVMAADGEFSFVANIKTNQTESNKNNNSSAVVVSEVVVHDSSSTSTDSDQNNNGLAVNRPKLSIQVRNNVNDFVRPNDVVTFEIRGKNEGDSTVYNSYIEHRIFDDRGKLVSQNNLTLGDVINGHGGTLTFGVPISWQMDKPGSFRSETRWIGEDEKGAQVTSDISRTSFSVNFYNQIVRIVNKPVAANEGNGAVLGAEIDTGINQKYLRMLPYIIIFIISGSWVFWQSSKWIKAYKKIES
jgi:hypothetical protein